MRGTMFDSPHHRAVMTYNLKNGKKFLHWRRRRGALANAISRERPLLVGTQEGLLYQLQDLRRRLQGYDYVGVGRSRDRADERVAIFYDTARVAIIESGTFWLAERHDQPGSKIEGEDLPRIATWARCAIDGHDQEIIMVNTHLTWQDIGLEVQTATLVEGIDRVAGREVDVLLTGDFNQPRRSPTWEKVVAAGFADAVDFAETVEGPPFTFADWRVWSDAEVADVTRDHRIDWIMYRPAEGQPLPSGTHLRVVNTHTRPDPPSDHFPVVLANQQTRRDG